jgi:hypothetical protein
MKKIFQIAVTALMALAALSGCRNAEQEVPEASSVKTVRFHAGAAPTRTAFAEAVDGVYQTLWTENDSDILLSLNYGKAETSAVTPSADGTTASFEASFDASATSAPYTFYAVSPASAARAISPSRSAWSVYIAAFQHPSALSVDEDAQLLVAKSAASATLPGEVDLHFSHLTAYGRIALKNLELGDATVSKVDLVFSTPVVGEWYWGEDGTLTANGDSHTITLDTDASGDLWFACAPVDVSGQTLKLVVFTDQGNLIREITFPEGRKFNSGKVARFSVDMAGIEIQGGDTFVLVTDASELQVGDEVLVVSKDGTYALGAQQSNYRKEVSVNATGGVIADPGEATVLTLELGSAIGTWSFRTGNAYLASTSSGNNLTEVASKNANASWKVTVSSSATLIQAQAGGSKLLKHNPSAHRFSCYKNSSTNVENVVLYRKGSVPASVEDDPLTAYDAYGSYLTGVERTYEPGVDQLLRSYPDGKLEFAILRAADKEQLVVSGFDPSLAKGDAVTVTVAWRKGLNFLLKEKSFDLKVVKEDGPKVWLGDGSGQGLILKK